MIPGTLKPQNGNVSALLILTLAISAVHTARASLPLDLRCESKTNPMGVEAPRPQLSWILEGSGHDRKQSACQILVATTPERLTLGQPDLWDSGQVDSSQSVHVAYGGVPLASRQRCHWKVRVWDSESAPSDWSAPATWEMGLLHPEDWQATWIGSGPAREPRPAHGFFRSTAETNEPVVVDSRSTLLRKSFVTRMPVREARVYVSGLGYYELQLNGPRVGDQVLAPAKTNYRQWVLYDVHDVTPLIRFGTNVLGVTLGNGWFNPSPKWWQPYRMQWFGSKRLLLQLHLTYVDGSEAVIVSDDTWKTAPGPVLDSCIYDGEIHDATQDRAGWPFPEFDDSRWQPANRVEPPGGRLTAHLLPPIRVIETIRPVALTQPKPGVFIYDLGQNFAGWAHLTVSGPRGTRVTLRYAEDLDADGMLDARSNEKALATDVYLLLGEGRETYAPRFTFHGFQYVEVTGHPGTPRLDDLFGCVVHTDCPITGKFTCDNELVNRIHRATLWSQRSNLMGYPMDCPQRDERLGWLGDALVTAEEAMLNFDSAPFWRHWLDGIRFNQNPADGDISIVSPRPYTPEEPDPTWSSAYPVTVWQYYCHYGDRRFLGEHFESMRRYVDYLGTQATNHILPRYWIGDWGSTVEGWQEGDPVLVGTAFYFYGATVVAKAARVLDQPDAALRYADLAARIKQAFNAAFYDPQRQLYGDGSQFANAFPLVLGLVEPSNRAAVLQNILDDLGRRDGHFTVGVLGAKYLIEALTEHGRPDVAWQLVNQRGYPGWAHMLEGRNTLSEFWDLKGSHNHAMMGSVDAWFYRTLAGIQPDEERPGFERIIIKPFIPDSLGRVDAGIQTVRGPIQVSWRKLAGVLRLTVTIPANSTATVFVPASESSRIESEPRRPIARHDHGSAVYELGSGTYEFRAPLWGQISTFDN